MTADADASAARSTGAAPSAPTNALAVVRADDRIDVGWQDNSSNETGFEVQRSAAGATGSFTVVANLGQNVVAYGDGGRTPLTEYCYRIRAVRVTGGKTNYSAFATVACATTTGPPPQPPAHIPAAASDVTAIPSNSTTVNVTWHGNEAGVTTYRAYRSVDDGVTWSVFSTNQWDYSGYALPYTLSATDAAAQGDQRVCYRVVASSSTGDAPPSAVTCTVPVATPMNVSLTRIDGTTVDMSWSDESSIEETYEIWGNFTSPYRCDGPACNADVLIGFALIATLPASSTSYRCAQCTEPYWVDPDTGEGTYLTHLYVIAAKSGTRSYYNGALVP